MTHLGLIYFVSHDFYFNQKEAPCDCRLRRQGACSHGRRPAGARLRPGALLISPRASPGTIERCFSAPLDGRDLATAPVFSIRARVRGLRVELTACLLGKTARRPALRARGSSRQATIAPSHPPRASSTDASHRAPLLSLSRACRSSTNGWVQVPAGHPHRRARDARS